MEREELIYGWNRIQGPAKISSDIKFDDETLRDGLQSPSVKDPELDEKIRCVHYMEQLGMFTADLGLPGAGPVAREHITQMVQEIADNKMKLIPNLACRTMVSDIEPVVEIQQKTGISCAIAMFIGSSEIRKVAEEWDLEGMLKTSTEAIEFCNKHGLPIMYVTEDTSRATPETIKALYTNAIDHGVRWITVCDTVGYSTPDGIITLMGFIVDEVVKPTGVEVQIDWHGHRDRGLSVINSLFAAECGASCIHGTILGIGERAGNAPLDQILVNCALENIIDRDLTVLGDYVKHVSKITGVEIPAGYPAFGEDAFLTGTGVHAAAVVKSLMKDDIWLADRVYSAVPAHDFGLEQNIAIGPMSGKWNARYWLKKHGYEESQDLIDKIMAAAKNARRLLTDDEIETAIN
ncbi:MAG: 2-isopropylmalate synthase [Planctomycetota bacterium]|nr:MAG: 2-isopropylmalate synthase [Planctomycetota bacterium]